MNTPETPIYHKKDNVFGQYESRKAIRKEDLVIFCEGQTDVISAHQAGFQNIVAPLGTALTKEQLQKLAKLTKNFLFIFDSDQAGQEAMQRALLLISKLELRAYAASPDPYKDIDELLQKKPKAFKQLIKNKTDLFSFLFSKKIEDLTPSDYTDVTTALNWVRDILSKIPSQTLRSIYVNSLENTRFFDNSMLNDIKKELINSSRRKAPPGERKEKINVEHITRQEKMLAMLLVHDDISIPEDFELKYFTNTNIQDILTFIRKKKKVTKQLLLKEDFKEYIEDAIFHFSEIDEKDDIDKLYNLIKIDYYDSEEKNLKKKIAIAETRNNVKESEKLLQQFLKLTEERQNATKSS
jgi:DNA primase